MEHFIEPHLLKGAVRVAVIGCGGTGSRVATSLMELHSAMVALGHPAGLDVCFVDGDTVSEANVGRQAFYYADIGRQKAEVLAQRASMCFGLQWSHYAAYLGASDRLDEFDIVIGCVDSRRGRFSILRAMERSKAQPRYWLDFGNRGSDGQAILGHVIKDRRSTNGTRLPHVAELFPAIIDVRAESPDDGPSCSLAEALEKQDLFINRTLVDHGMNILWKLFRHGRISNHGVFVNTQTERVSPLPINPVDWERFGYRQEVRQKTPRLKEMQASHVNAA